MKSPQRRFPKKHAFGPLQIARGTPFASKNTKNRIKRWAKRVMKRISDENVNI